MAVEQDRFDFGQRGVITVQIRPTSLDHRDPGINEIWKRAAQKIGRRKKIRVEDGDEFAGRGLETRGKRPGLETGADVAMQVADWQSERLIALDAAARDLLRFIGRVIEHLNVEQLARIIKARYRVHEALDHVALVIDRKLYGNLGPLGDRGRRAGNIVAGLEISIQKVVA